MNNAYILAAIAVMSVVTVLLRALPFIVFSGGKPTPALVSYLGKVLPYAIIGMLVVYCLKGIDPGDLQGWLPSFIGVAVTAGLHAWKRNTLLSIISGTVVYMLLVQLVF